MFKLFAYLHIAESKKLQEKPSKRHSGSQNVKVYATATPYLSSKHI